MICRECTSVAMLTVYGPKAPIIVILAHAYWEQCGTDCFFATFYQLHSTKFFFVFFSYLLVPAPSIHILLQTSTFAPNFWNPALESTNPVQISAPVSWTCPIEMSNKPAMFFFRLDEKEPKQKTCQLLIGSLSRLQT